MTNLARLIDRSRKSEEKKAMIPHTAETESGTKVRATLCGANAWSALASERRLHALSNFEELEKGIKETKTIGAHCSQALVDEAKKLLCPSLMDGKSHQSAVRTGSMTR